VSKIYGGRYEIEEKIGAGGMAIVYKAKDTVLNRVVAIKVLREQYASDEGFIRRFRREAQAAASLSHQNIVSIFDVGKDGDEDYIVMEYVKGRTLKEIIRDQAPLPVETALSIIRQIAEALAHAHANHIIHRDIKPQNIIISTTGRAKVTDFGIARAASSATLTRTGDIVGSVHYLSPEQAKGEPTSEQSDIYSMGIILYEMITGKVPYDGDTPITIALKHVQQEVELPGKIGLGVSPEIDTMILKALAKSVEDRYKSADEFLSDLDRIQAGQTIIWERTPTADEHDTLRTQVHKGLKDKVLASNKGNLENTLQKNQRPKRKIPKRVLIPAVVLVVLVGLSLGLWKIFHVPVVTVPDLKGLTLAQAEQELKKVNLYLDNDNIKYEFSDEEDVYADQIFRQTYAPNSQVKAGRKIGVSVSKGPEMLEFPNVTAGNPSLENAENMIRAAGFEGEIKKEYRFDPLIPENHVIGQNPGVLARWPKKSEITLFVSKGKELTLGVMPDVTWYPATQAKETLEAFNLKVTPQSMPSDEFPAEAVIKTIPAAGQPVKQGSEVVMIISEGPGPPP